MWIEDPVFMDHLSSLGDVCKATSAPIAVGETRGGRADYRSLELNSLAQAIMDISWEEVYLKQIKFQQWQKFGIFL